MCQRVSEGVRGCQCAFVERNGSGVELRTLDYENPGSNPVLWCFQSTLLQFTQLYK